MNVGQSAHGHVTYLNVTKMGNKIIVDGYQKRSSPKCRSLQGLPKRCLLDIQSNSPLPIFKKAEMHSNLPPYMYTNIPLPATPVRPNSVASKSRSLNSHLSTKSAKPLNVVPHIPHVISLLGWSIKYTEFEDFWSSDLPIHLSRPLLSSRITSDIA